MNRWCMSPVAKHYYLSSARKVALMANKTSQRKISIRKHGRVWAVYLDSELLALVVYKKGANAVKDLIEKLASHADRRPSN